MSHDLQAESLRRFDQLVAEGQVVFQDAPPIIVPSKPFNFQFRIANSLTKKPQIDINAARALEKENQIATETTATTTSPASDQQTQESNENDKDNQALKKTVPAAAPAAPRHRHAGSPFDRDPPSFVLDHPTAQHTLRLNKYCVVCPQFVLHTDAFASQLEPLTQGDFAAGWSALRRLGDGFMLIFNGGPHGGWSIPHRHMQLLPLAVDEGEGEDGFALFPDSCGIGKDGRSPGIPYDHAVRPLPTPAGSSSMDDATTTITPAHLHSLYTTLLSAANVDASIEHSHNLLLTHRWMLVIPRTRAALPGVNVINAAAMVGMTWVPSQEVWRAWQTCADKMKLLQSLGRPLGG